LREREEPADGGPDQFRKTLTYSVSMMKRNFERREEGPFKSANWGVVKGADSKRGSA